MSTYVPNPTHVGTGRPPCESCGANWHLHYYGAGEDAANTAAPRCPAAYRPETLEAAQRELAAAEATGDEARTFVARGNVQRLTGRP